MARSFASASSQYLSYAGSPFGATWSMSAWIYRASSGGNHVVLSNSGTTGAILQELLVNSSNVMQYYYQDSVSHAINISGGAVSTNTWTQVGFVATSGEHRIYLNGSSVAVATDAIASPTLNDIMIGVARYTGSLTAYFNGRISEVAAWNVALTGAEMASLASAMSPTLIRPASLAAYWPLGGHHGNHDADHWKNRYDMTAVNSPTWVDHPRVIYPRRRSFPVVATVAPPAASPHNLLLLGVGT